jgi:EmrB/QacA subfamily drug resistance transporter
MTAVDSAAQTEAEIRERECPVLPCVLYTPVNADRLSDEAAPPAPQGTEGGPEPVSPAPEGTEDGDQRLGLALLLISTAQLMVVLDATIVTVALPSIQKSLHFSPSDLQWVISAYTLAFGGLLLFGGRLGDVLGRRRVFVAGLLAFSAGSLAGGLATSSAWLVCARAFQGAGAAVAAPTALSLIGDTFPEGPPRTRAMGVYAAMSGAGSAVGLLLGGVLTDVASWRWVLFVNVPIGIVVAVAAPRVLAKSAARGGHLDIPGAVAATAATTSLVYGLVRAPTSGWADPVTLLALVAAPVLFAAFIAVEARSTHPLMPLRLLANRNRAATYAVMLCSTAALLGVFFFFLTQLLQNVYGYSAIRAGVAFLPFSLGIAASSQLVVRLIGRTGPRVFTTLGPLLLALGLVWLSGIGPHSTYWSDIFGPFVVVSVALGFIFVPAHARRDVRRRPGGHGHRVGAPQYRSSR